MSTKFPIQSGPSKFDLMTSLMVRGCIVRFKLADMGWREVAVNGLKAEDGSKEKWFLEGYAKGTPKWIHCTGYYNLDSRSGSLQLDGVSHHCSQCGTEHEVFGTCPQCDNAHCKECGAQVERGYFCTDCGN